MANRSETFPALVKEVRRQLEISQEELSHELGVSFATINLGGKRQDHAVQAGAGQFDAFCKRMLAANKLDLTEWIEG